MSLLVHCGAERTAWEDLTKVKTPDPTNTHVPIPHHNFVEMVREALPENGFQVVQEEHALSKDGQSYFGVIKIEDPEFPSGLDGFSRVIGLRNSHNKRIAAGLVSGSQVFVCDNMAFSGEVQLTHKHTSQVQAALPRLVADAILGLKPLLNAERQRVKAYRAHDLGTGQEYEVDHLLMEMLRRDAVSSSQIGKAWDNWINPPHPEFEERSLWSLFNAVTEAHKGTGMRTLFLRSLSLHKMCDEITDFAPMVISDAQENDFVDVEAEEVNGLVVS